MNKTTMWRILAALALLAVVVVAVGPTWRTVASTWTPKALVDDGGAVPASTWST